MPALNWTDESLIRFSQITMANVFAFGLDSMLIFEQEVAEGTESKPK